jgi:rhodanese-related sulfurtransferase
MMQKRVVLIAGIVVVLVGAAVLGLTLQQSTATGTPVISQEELLERIDSHDEILILDVRTQREFDGGRVPGAKLIPHTEVMDRIDEIIDFMDKPVVVYCEAGGRARLAETQLREAGFTDLLHLDGDMRAWRTNGRPIEK